MTVRYRRLCDCTGDQHSSSRKSKPILIPASDVNASAPRSDKMGKYLPTSRVQNAVLPGRMGFFATQVIVGWGNLRRASSSLLYTSPADDNCLAVAAIDDTGPSTSATSLSVGPYALSKMSITQGRK